MNILFYRVLITGCYLWTFIIFLSNGVQAQELLSQIDRPDNSGMELRVTYMPGDAPSIVELWVQLLIPYNTLAFTDSAGMFRAQVDVEVTVKARGAGAEAESWLLSENVATARWLDTESDRRTVELHGRYSVMPGVYDVRCRRRAAGDEESTPAHRLIQIPHFADEPLEVGNFLFYQSDKAGEQAIIPGDGAIPVTPEFGDPLLVHLPVWSRSPVDSLMIRWQFQSMGDLDWTMDSSLVAATNGQWTILRHAFYRAPAEAGPYILTVTVDDLQGREQQRQTTMALRWLKRPLDDAPLTRRLMQLRYVLKPSEREQFSQSSQTEQETIYHEHWKRETRQWNRVHPERPDFVQQEYYRRVDYANQQFWTPQQEGWESDRGRIFILYGPPSSIDRNFTTDTGAPQEDWEYLSLKRRYNFTDPDRMGQLRLQEVEER